MRFQDLVFNEIEGAPPARSQWRCNQCGAQGVTLAAMIPLPDQGSGVAIIALCSRACERIIRRHPWADEFLAEILARVVSMRLADVQWPEEIDVPS